MFCSDTFQFQTDKSFCADLSPACLSIGYLTAIETADLSFDSAILLQVVFFSGINSTPPVLPLFLPVIRKDTVIS